MARGQRLTATDWALLGLGALALGGGIWALMLQGQNTGQSPYSPPATPLPPLPPSTPSSSPVIVQLDASPTGSPVTVSDGQTLTFQAPTGGTIDTISTMAVNAPSYSGTVQNSPGQESTPVTWHDSAGSYTTTIPITVVEAAA